MLWIVEVTSQQTLYNKKSNFTRVIYTNLNIVKIVFSVSVVN